MPGGDPTATPDDGRDERLAKAFAPALFAESLDALLNAELLVRELPTDHPRRAAVIWRALELRVTFDPAGVLAQLDADAPPPDDSDRSRRVPIAAMLACGELDRATAELAAFGFETAPTWDVLRGQLALARGDHAGAERHLARARAATDLEDRAHALMWSLEAAGRARDQDAVAHHAIALDALLGAAGAPTSQQMVALQALMAKLDQRQMIMGPLFASRAQEAKDALCEGIAEDQAMLGTIPRHVHAAFRKLRDNPPALEAALLNIAGLQVRGEQKGEAYATIAYAARLAPRLLPPPAAERWRASLARFREVLGPAQVRTSEDYLAMREETFLRTMRRS